MTGRQKAKKILGFCLILIAVPLTVAVGVWLFADRKYYPVAITAALFSCLPFFLRFEKGRNNARELAVIAVMTAFSIVGRLVFAPIPGFKPVTAMTMITGVALGPESGFMVGSMTALVTNFYYGQGPWTPFQMFAWGILGFFSGFLGLKKKPKLPVLCVAGAVGGLLFSFLMDLWVVLAPGGDWSFSGYAAIFAAGLPVAALYSVSNVIFLLILAKPFLSKLDRIKKKYGLFDAADRQTETAAPGGTQ